MGIRLDLLRQVKEGLGKEAYAPPAPDPAMAGMPMTDPAMAAAGGMPPGGGGMPMDPAMMAGMPPMDPAMMGGGAPPMPGVDPMTGLPPMDPAAMGGMPMDPAAMAGMMPPLPGGAPEGAPEGEVVQLSMDDLRAILAEASGKEAPEGGGEGGGSVEERLSTLEEMLTVLLSQFGLGEGMLPPEEGAPPAGQEMEMPPEAAAPAGMPLEAPVQDIPQDFSLLEAPMEQPTEKTAKVAKEDNNEYIRRLRQAMNA